MYSVNSTQVQSNFITSRKNRGGCVSVCYTIHMASSSTPQRLPETMKIQVVPRVFIVSYYVLLSAPHT